MTRIAREPPRSETSAPKARDASVMPLRKSHSRSPISEKGGQGSLLSPAANYQRVGHLIHMSLACPDSALAVNAGGPAIQRKNTARALALPELSAHKGRQDCGYSLAVGEWLSSNHGLMSLCTSLWLSPVSDTSFSERPHRLRPVCPALRWSHRSAGASRKCNTGTGPSALPSFGLLCSQTVARLHNCLLWYRIVCRSLLVSTHFPK